jgi:hypothetical protein
VPMADLLLILRIYALYHQSKKSDLRLMPCGDAYLELTKVCVITVAMFIVVLWIGACECLLCSRKSLIVLCFQAELVVTTSYL